VAILDAFCIFTFINTFYLVWNTHNIKLGASKGCLAESTPVVKWSTAAPAPARPVAGAYVSPT